MEMRTVLIYPPFAWPSAPPLGISLLKSYVESRAAGAGVACLDLNIEFFSNPAPLVRSLCRLCRHRGRGGCLPPAAFVENGLFQASADFFRNGGSQFFNPRKHAENYIYVRSFLERAGDCHERILREYVEGRTENEATAERLVSRLGKKILALGPDLAGFSAQGGQAAWSLALAKWLKRNSGVKTVLGGFFPSFCGAEDIVRAFPFVDFAVAGEGEKALAGLIGMLNGARGGVPGLVYLRRGRLSSSPREAERDLDSLPFPDFSDYPIKKYFTPAPVLPVLASRGCPWGRCAFCAHGGNYAKTYRERSPRNVALELERQAAAGARHFLFCDEHVSGRRLEELSAAAAGLGITFGLAGLKTGRTVTRPRLEAARRAGCRWVYIGAESFSPRLLKLMGKGVRAEETIRTARDCAEAGITPFISYIWGFPTQTKREVMEEASVIRKNIGFMNLPDDGHQFVLEKGSPVWENPERFRIARTAPLVMFETSGGRVFSGRYRYGVEEGLTPLQAQAAYRPGPDVPYETHSFWESLILLAERGVKLSFNRNTFFSRILISPEVRISRALKKHVKPNAESVLARGLCFLKLGKHREAEKEFLKLREMKVPKSFVTSALMNLGAVHEKAGEFEKAGSLFRQAVWTASEPADRAAAVFRIAACMEKDGDAESAIQMYRYLLSRYPGGPFEARALAGLGACLVRSGDFNAGIEALKASSAADMEGEHAVAIRFHLIEAYEKTGNRAAALKEKKRLGELL